MRSHGIGAPSWPLRSLSNAVFWLRERCVLSVEIESGGSRLVFRCRSRRALRRATTLFVKEQGTIEWLQSTVREGDVLLDIGANIGIYTMLAAARVGANGHVFAVEPHIFNATNLLENVAANDFTGRVSVLTVALGPEAGFGAFNYRDWEIGSAFSQLGSTTGEGGRQFQPVAREWKHATTVDNLVEQRRILPPTLIKLDVDGLEPGVVRGMWNLLRSASRPRSVQIEVSPSNRAEVEALMTECGYRVEARHHTMAGKKHIRRGVAEMDLDHNAVFVPV